jgi:hypothetical protein
VEESVHGVCIAAPNVRPDVVLSAAIVTLELLVIAVAAAEEVSLQGDSWLILACLPYFFSL